MLENKDNLKKIVFFILILNPFIDVATSLYLRVFKGNNMFTPGIIIRNVILLYLIFYFIRHKNKIKNLILLAMTLILTMVVQIFYGVNYNVFLEIQYYFRFLLNFLFLIFIEDILKLFKYENKIAKQILRYINYSGAIFALIIVLSFIFGVDFKTYRSSFSSKGLFYAGNEVAAVLSVVYPISIYFLVSGENVILNYFLYIATLLSMVLVGTRVALGSIIVTLIAFIIFSLYSYNKNLLNKIVKIILLSMICVFVFIKGVLYFKNINLVQHNIERQIENYEKTQKDTTTYVLSSRNIKLKQAYKEYKESPLIRKVFGIGRGSQKLTIEMDFAEVVIYYGIFGTITMLLPVITRGVRYILKILSFNKDVLYISIFLSLALGFGSSFLAGHVLFSAAGIYSFMILGIASCFTEKE